MTTQGNEGEIVRSRGTGGGKVAIAAILMVGAIILACILGFTVTAVIFIYNAPW